MQLKRKETMDADTLKTVKEAPAAASAGGDGEGRSSAAMFSMSPFRRNYVIASLCAPTRFSAKMNITEASFRAAARKGESDRDPEKAAVFTNCTRRAQCSFIRPVLRFHNFSPASPTAVRRGTK